jgi:hypothetical protein
MTLKNKFNSPTKLKQRGDSYTPEPPKYAGLPIGPAAVFVSQWPPAFIQKNTLYVVGEINGAKHIVVTTETGDIGFEGSSNQYRFFNSSNEQIG